MTDLFEDQRPSYGSASFPEPRPFQTTAHEALRQGLREGHRCQMLMSPTGSGKTYLGLRIAHEALVKGRRAIFICDRRTLINQTSAVADSYGLGAHGVLMANHWRVNAEMPLQIASAQTLARRDFPHVDVAIIDEAHTQMAVWVEWMQQTKAAVIGLSATPFSAGLGKLFTNLVNATTMHALTESGVLVPMRVLSAKPIDMRGAATSGGEWTDQAAGERGMDIVGDVVTEWQKHGEGRKTICFGATIAHCEELCKQFNEAGVLAQLYTSNTNEGEREQILREYRKPDSAIRVLISVEALAKGFDVPDVGCVIDCRPLRKSLSTFIQMIGRGARSSPSTGKQDFLLLDHSGNIRRFKDDFAEVFYNGLAALDAGEKLDKAIRRDDEEGKEPKACPQCGYKPVGIRCIACGFKFRKVALVEHLPGEMEPVFIGKAKLADDHRHLYEQICSYTRSHGNPDTAKGRAAHLFKEFVGDFPRFAFDRAPNTPITREVLNRIVRRNIAFGRAQAGKKAA